MQDTNPSAAAVLQGALAAAFLAHGLFSHNPFFGVGIALAAATAAFVVFQLSMSYMPGGRRNPLSAVNVEKRQLGAKMFVWAAALTGTIAIYGAALWLMIRFVGPQT
jgi:hypothetical protein